MSDSEERPAPRDLQSSLAEALACESPAMTLEATSVLASVDPEHIAKLEGANAELHPVTQLTHAFFETDEPETNAVVRVWAEILGEDMIDDLLRRRIRASVSKRKHPAWIDQLKDARVTRVVSQGDHYGEQETLLVEVRVGDHTFALACALTHAGGVSLEDAYLLPASVDEAYAMLPTDIRDSITVTELDQTTAARTLRSALRLSDMMYPPVETATWPGARPALDWVLRLLPEAEAEWAEPLAPEVLDRIVAEFERSPEAHALPAEAVSDASLLLDFSVNYGAGDPLRWGPMFTERLLLDLVPRKFMAPDHVLLRIPRVLEAVVTWAHRQSGISEADTKVVLDLITAVTPEYRALVKQGHPGSLASVFNLGPDDGSSITPDYLDEYFLGQLEALVGGAEQLTRLNDAPLPAESFAVAAARSEIPADIADKVHEIAELIETVGARYFGDPELVTVALRLLVRFATEAPQVFRRRAKNESTACVLCWIAAQNNDWFDGHRNKARSTKALMAAFNVKTPPQDRAYNLLADLGVFAMGPFEVALSDASLLISSARAEIISQRDQ